MIVLDYRCNNMEDLMQMHEMTEADIRSQFIDPALRRAGWDDHAQIRREHDFTDGRVIVNGHQTARGKRKRADYILYHCHAIEVFRRFR